ncbi:ABC transporter permease [Aureimonas phyllosphaerae]|uniref:Peptide/nickel transport system permease protein n=1 Tax=Aureimonas phyllosphaerae TaxID=1166078 RepID=A0A7W6FSK3_9HYPH|nr:ABC transporter permease [Aureimonas phyllosphaerae]MBB3934244.1 peptide/nickel transport system permease protein [Aureimonas phyllosphaerae]MBB3958540.1 peptide/nickel transport system permease protein [Aureimonas phyllosphaerae]SFE98564.1 peptide/nickel transport system permease protein [Aureimonas phyllosphaerae]
MATGLLSSQIAYNWRRNTSAILGSAIILACAIVVVFGPALVAQNPYDVMQLDLMDSYLPPAWMDGGNPKYWLGTDGQGRDVLAAVVYGTRISALIGLAATLMSCVIGTFLGLMAGYFGGWIDAVIMRVADIQLSFPSMLIALFLMSAFGNGIDKILISLTAVGWVVYARTVRGSTLGERNREYVQAARVAGLRTGPIIRRHILPNVLTPLIVVATVQVGTFILIEASLSFLGVGVPVTQPSLGLLIKNGFDVLFSGLWWTSLFPGLMIMAMVFGINLVGDFLRDELNPRLK